MLSAVEKKQGQVEELVGPVLEAIPAGRRQIAEPLLREFLEDLSSDDLRQPDPERFTGVLGSLLGWIEQRKLGDEATEIRIFNPADDGAKWADNHTVIEILTTDKRFLVDSVTAELRKRDLTIYRVLHPQLASRRDETGKLLEILPAGSPDTLSESAMQFQVDRIGSQAERVDLETSLYEILEEVRLVVSDFRPIKDACLRAIQRLERHKPPVAADELKETIEFLEWVEDDHFTFFGYIEFDLEKIGGEDYLKPNKQSALGLRRFLTLPEKAAAEQPLARHSRAFLEGGELVAIHKSPQRSRVHRPVHMDVITLKRFSYTGEVDGTIQLIGLFTSMAYNIAAREIPLVRRKVQRVVERTGFLPNSHDAKALRYIVEDYPRDELFQISADDLYNFALRLLDLQLRPRLALLVRRDDEERFVSCLVYLPRERHSTEIRLKIQRILEATFAAQGETVYASRISERPVAQLHYIIRTSPGHIPEYTVEQVEAELAEAIRTWPDLLRATLIGTSGEEEGRLVFGRYAAAFSPAYQQYVPAIYAALDIPQIESTLASGELSLRIYKEEGSTGVRFHLRTFELGSHRSLSDMLPMLENMGLQVISENPFEAMPAGASQKVWVRDFEAVAQDGARLDEDADNERFHDAFRRVYQGEVESDGFNKLVLQANLTWRQVIVLRAYSKYLRQAGAAFSQAYMEQTLARYGGVARGLIELFEDRFDPAKAQSAKTQSKRGPEILESIQQQLEGVKSLDEDRILRRFLNLVQSTLRTNYWQLGADGNNKPYLSFKLDSAEVVDLPKPRPMFEVFVYSPRVEAVHLRGGKVARGGIRWSDRLEDFRTEILGLVKSQMVKNAVIVPVGAKGGFIVKKPPVGGGRDEFQREGIECYKTLIRGLLDLTDNYQGSKVIQPPNVVRRDGDDPYLVVAADKGTATFSDIANGVAAEYGFWLGDAFASGGSLGYDHKKMAITAKGAWESVMRHFREMGRNSQTEPFTCVGVGDMAGDVFGNGMLLSPTLQLVGAFNHLHIFVDPKPDAARSLAERQRLFDLPRSTWNDYDRELLSPGGAIFERSAKKLTVSREVKELFGLQSDTCTPAELIKALLKAEVDLLFFGGIGTFVKAQGQTHAEVGDRSNDELRVDGAELRAKVVGEGANLGMTQLGRIEYASLGGRLNTDFIDNSGGVDCSDHEVNIKIALGAAKERGELDEPGRQAILVEMTGDVAQLVLRDNYLQSQAISLVEFQGAKLLDGQAKLMRDLEKADRLDRRLEFLPSDAVLEERRQSRRGLTRPEIAILLAYSKMAVYNDLLESDLPDDARLVDDLVAYFPKAMQERQRQAIETHRLRREIIATHAANSMVNRVGPGFIARMRDETGRQTHEVAWAYVAARGVFELRSVWEEIEALDNQVAAAKQTEMMLDTVELIGAATRFFLRQGGGSADIAACRNRYEDSITVTAAQIEDLLPNEAKKRVRRRREKLVADGVPDSLAARIAVMPNLPSACNVALCAENSKVEVDQVGRIYFLAGERFGLDRLLRAAEILGGEGSYQEQALFALEEDLTQHHIGITERILEAAGSRGGRNAMNHWVEQNAEAVSRLDQMLDDFSHAGHIDLAMLAIAERTLRRLAGPGRP
jgi:glutamate dehydrogenase